MHADELEARLRRTFATAPSEIIAVYLYGSRARGTSVRELRALARPAELGTNVVGLRNVLVHGCDTVDGAVVPDVLERRLDDMLRVVTVIRSRLR